MALIPQLVTTLAGRAIAQRFGGLAAGPAGMVLGAALPFVAKRLGPMGMVGLAVGAWAVGKLVEARAESEAKPEPAIGLPLPDLVEAPDPNPHPGSDLVPDPR